MKIVSALLGIALMVAGGVALHLSREVDAGRQQVADLKAQLQERDARIATLAATPATPPAVPVAATTPQAVSPATAASPSAATAQPAATAAVQDLLATIRQQSSSPEGMARRRLTARVLLEGSNPDIGEALGLAPEEADKLLDLLVTHQERTSELFLSTVEGNSATAPQERSAAILAQQRTNEAELQDMLGSKYSEWKDYEDARSAWQQRRDLRAVLDAGGIPMTDAQSKSLIAAIAAEQRAVTRQSRDAAIQAASQGTPFSEVISRYTPERRQRLLDAAAPHLSPQQLEGYRGMLERAAAQERSMRSSLQAAADAAQDVAAAAAR
jgi:hypothetical protein